MSMGYASSCLQDEWSILNNVAGLAKVDKTTAGFSYEAQPAFKSFNRMAAVLIQPINKIGVVGAGVYRFGDDLYNEQILTVGFANSFGIASLGLKVNYIQYHAEGFGNTQAVTISFGGIVSLTPKLLVGAHIININQPELSQLSEEKLPTLLTLGLGFKLSEKVLATSEVEKDLDYDVVWKSGIEYQVHKKFIIRTGLNLNSQAGFAGFGFKPKKLKLDYAFQYHMNLGVIHQTTIAFSFNAKK